MKVKTVTNTTYVAFDGTEFRSQSDCERYERDNETRAIREKVMAIPHTCFDAYDVEYSSSRGNDVVYLFKPQTMDDINTLNEWGALEDDNDNIATIEEDMVNESLSDGVMLYCYDDFPYEFQRNSDYITVPQAIKGYEERIRGMMGYLHVGE